jgi:hypothetical protein
MISGSAGFAYRRRDLRNGLRGARPGSHSSGVGGRAGVGGGDGAPGSFEQICCSN